MQKGTKHKPETIEKIRKKKLENPSRVWQGKKLSEEHRKKLSDAKKGKPGNNQTKGRTPWNKGKPWPERYGENSPLWKGGKCTESLTWRNRIQNRIWREQCLERDGHMCVNCKKTGRLHVHHRKGWNAHPDLRFDINNGITLCIPCHTKMHWIERKEN